MSLQRLPIMDRLFIGSSYGVMLGREIHTWPIGKLDYEHFADHKRVLLDDSDRIQSRPTKTWDVRKTFGHLMLPYPRVWIEWNNIRGEDTPDIWMAASCERVDALPEEGWQIPASSLGGLPLGSVAATRRGIKAHSWVARPFMLHGDHVVSLPMFLQVDLDESGVLHGVRGSNIGPVPKADDTSAVVDLMWDALVAVGWMNCRNVRVERHERVGNPRASKSKRNRNLARSLDFHTIHIPGVEYDSNGSAVGSQRDLRMHHVRGHFKTFTADAPLMGQHVGTYWWGWQVRGSRDNGVVVSDYKVGAPA